jgi:hypothetical protein
VIIGVIVSNGITFCSSADAEDCATNGAFVCFTDFGDLFDDDDLA